MLSTTGEWVVDPDARKVACKGKARFKWTEGVGKGQGWDEKFAYVLDFDDEGKVTDYQVWADSGAAYLARLGQLNNLREVRLSVRMDRLRCTDGGHACTRKLRRNRRECEFT